MDAVLDVGVHLRGKLQLSEMDAILEMEPISLFEMSSILEVEPINTYLFRLYRKNRLGFYDLPVIGIQVMIV